MQNPINPWHTIVEVCDELGIGRSTMDDWRRSGRGPEFLRLPNGSLRIRRRVLDAWTDALKVA